MSEFGFSDLAEEQPKKRNLLKILVIPCTIAAVVLIGVAIYLLVRGGSAPSGTTPDNMMPMTGGIGMNVETDAEPVAQIAQISAGAALPAEPAITVEPPARTAVEGSIESAGDPKSVVYSSNNGSPLPVTPPGGNPRPAGGSSNVAAAPQPSIERIPGNALPQTTVAPSTVSVEGTTAYGAFTPFVEQNTTGNYKTPSGKPVDDLDIVYVDDRGTLFHRRGCTQLKTTAHPMPYDRALEQRMQPCAYCSFNEYALNMLAPENETPLPDGKTVYTVNTLVVYLSSHDTHYHRGDCARVKYSRTASTYWDAYTKGYTSCPECGSGDYCRIMLGLMKLPEAEPAAPGPTSTDNIVVPTPKPTPTANKEDAGN